MDAQANQTADKLEPLHQVLKGDIPKLLKNLETHGSEALGVVSLIKTVLDRWVTNNAYRCIIFAPEGGEKKGVCVILLSEYELKRVLLFAPEDETIRFLKCLEETNLIPWDAVFSVARLMKRLREPVDKILEAKGYQLYGGDWNCVMMMSPKDALALEEPKLPDNVSLRDLTEDDSSTLAKDWNFEEGDSLAFIRDGLKYNGGIGAVDKDGELVGWIYWNSWGVLGQLFVSLPYRRSGLGRILTIQMSKVIAKNGHTVTAQVLCDNDASCKLFLSLGFRWDYVDCHRKIRHYN